jgi:UDP-4-amino-4,6-dideoxy-N-acetyl-beta-L-altrosamine N-acetyltransferase
MSTDQSQPSERVARQICRLVQIITLETDAQLAIRDIRNQATVRDAMFTDQLIGVNEHLQWISSLKRDPRKLAFALESPSRHPLGVISLGNWERLHGTATWGYYVSEDSRNVGLGTAMTCSFLDFVFDVLHLEKLNAEVIEANRLSITHHQNLGFENEGFRRSNVRKHGVRLGVYLFGMSKTDWNQKRLNVRKRYQHIFDATDVTVFWDADQSSLSPIDRIEEARARNNLNWMSILRLALERSPATAKQIVSEIKNIDQEISALTQEVIVKN